MAIEVTCSNGHKLKAKDELAGKKLKCPKCSVQVTVPFPEPATPDGESLLSDLEKLEQSAAHDPLAMDPLGNSAMDPLGGLPVDDWMAGVPLAANPVAHPAPARSTSEPSSSGSQFQLLLFFGIGGGGGAGLALIVLLLVWLLRSPAPATATNVLPPTSTNVAAPGSATQPRSASTVATNSAQPSPPIIPNAIQPPREASSKKSSVS